jgi:hypothetical protein
MTPEETKQEAIKRHPSLAKIYPFVDVHNKESDRGRVLVACGFLEQLLKEIIVAFMVEDAVVDEFFSGTAPLSTFSSRITGAFLFGLIAKNEFETLHLMRKIRNDFAHRLETTFDTDSVKNRCQELVPRLTDNQLKGSGNPVGDFSAAATLLMMSLIDRPKAVEKERRVVRFSTGDKVSAPSRSSSTRE